MAMTAAETTSRRTYRCGTLIDGTGALPQHDVALVVEGGLIASIGPWARHADEHEGQVYDASDATVMPGIIDAHTHLCGASRTIPGASTVPDRLDIAAWGMVACVSAITSGITTVVDVGSPDGLALRVGSLVASGMAVGPLVIAAGRAVTTTAGHGAEIGIAADTADQVVSAVRGCVGAGAGVIKLMVTGGTDDATPTNRRRAQYTEEQLAAGIADAHRLNRRVVGHANATEGISLAVRAGIDIVAHCNWLGREPGTVEIDGHTVQLMIEQDTHIDLNIEGALRDLAATDGTVINWPYSEPLPTTRWELLAPLRRLGVKLHLTSDAYGPAIASFPHSLCAVRERWGLPAEEIVWLATGSPAEALGIQDQRGMLVAGAAADIVVLGGNLQADPRAILSPVLVVRDGVEIVADGRVTPSAAAQSGADEAAAQQARLKLRFANLT